MLELIKKGLLAGLGAGAVTRDLVDQATAQLVEEGRLTREEARALADKLVESGTRKWEGLEDEVRQTLVHTVEGLGLARQQDLDRLRNRVADLEKQVERLSQGLEAGDRPGPKGDEG